MRGQLHVLVAFVRVQEACSARVVGCRVASELILLVVDGRNSFCSDSQSPARSDAAREAFGLTPKFFSTYFTGARTKPDFLLLYPRYSPIYLQLAFHVVQLTFYSLPVT